MFFDVGLGVFGGVVEGVEVGGVVVEVYCVVVLLVGGDYVVVEVEDVLEFDLVEIDL